MENSKIVGRSYLEEEFLILFVFVVSHAFKTAGKFNPIRLLIYRETYTILVFRVMGSLIRQNSIYNNMLVLGATAGSLMYCLCSELWKAFDLYIKR